MIHIVTNTHISGRGWAVLTWVVTRAAFLLFVFEVVHFPGQYIAHDVSSVYHRWYGVLSTGSFPLHDVTWQYPPGAALVILAPGLLPFLSYTAAFFWLAFLADAVILAVLLRDSRVRRGGRMAGVWVWVGGGALLGPIIYARYDVMVTAVAVAGLLLLPRRPKAGGVLAGVGAMLKVWPLLLLIGTPRGRTTRRSWISAAVTMAVIALAFHLAMPGSLSFLTFQRDRGTEVESLGATVFHIARHFGWHGTARMHYGSVEFIGPHVHLVSTAAMALSVLAFAWLLLWRLRARTYSVATPFDAAFTAVLVFTTTSRVISPQYMVWLVGVGAVCMTLRESVVRRPVALMLGATLFTTLEFPIFFEDIAHSDKLGVALIVTRNGLLVLASLSACRRLWAATVPRRAARGAVEGEPADAPAAVLTRAERVGVHDKG
ncbi:glycosyltransferase 87 family protein [Streptomyces sp. CBMA29]|uniref:glycosyltransferase 87 family protein n=1 Tax=Streptomyces sp. CBMA29 TaxID=1896314 RepID=UPI001661A1DB|nr:glycosyltransferase family 87 protein [Streptomyces sp. CBMA29]